MPSGFQMTPEAQRWIEEARERYGPPEFAHVASAVLWTDERGPDGKLLVEADPTTLVDNQRKDPAVLLQGHDPGRPVGQVLEAEAFTTPEGHRFVAGVVGYYGREGALTFAELGLTGIDAASPLEPDALASEDRIELAADPRDLPPGWLDEVMGNAPPDAMHVEMSYNAAETTQELIRIALAFGALWNPFAKAVATEAGKDAYAATKTWIKSVLERSRQLKSPAISLDWDCRGCLTSFLIRGNDPAVHTAAYEGLAETVVDGASLVARLEARGMPPASLVYEFDSASARWYPSYARLADGRIVVDSPMLIAVMQDLPKGLSLGMRKVDIGTPPE
ncbi:MAG: hypothetical protein AAGC76_05440 [Luteibacter sp.]|uniref:hypothetical protein n=1 Tax=Luteibacter sp. TaxID=1886636 RepID=UPI002809CB26|nr:hypothetical protein [Luteibacter sp.]MDQ7995281.1 hypothetical protein [Luteibacter sp.]